MHSACDFNGDHGSQEQILIHRIDRTNNHLNNNNNNNNNNSENNGHATTNTRNSNDELFMSASSTTEFTPLMIGSKVAATTPTPATPPPSIIGGDMLGNVGGILGTELLSITKTPTKATINKTPTPQLNETNRLEYDELLQWKDMPKHLQFNPYVLTGYRPLQTIQGCFYSLFYWHNETINILTHGKYLNSYIRIAPPGGNKISSMKYFQFVKITFVSI